MEFILGIDGGATKTISQITNLSGGVIAETKSGSSNYKSIGLEEATINIIYGITKAINKFDISGNIIFKSSCLGLAGLDDEEDLRIYETIIRNKKIFNYFNPEKIIICNDSKIAFAAGSDSKYGIVIICGTGSTCYGINEEGKEARSNTGDYILSDEGSAYSIGLKGLRAVTRSFDGRGKETILAKEILKYLELKNDLDLEYWVNNKTSSKKRIASISKLVCRASASGDKICMKILEEEAREAAISVMSVMHRLDLDERYFDLVLAGSVFYCNYFKKMFTNIIREKNKEIVFKTLHKKPVDGAIRLAMNIL